jgi:hypothetical protein
MTQIRADHTEYSIERRHQRKKGGKPLKGFALDVTIRFNSDGTPFVQDHNSAHGTMPFNSVDEVRKFIGDEIDRNFEEHFDVSAPSSSS